MGECLICLGSTRKLWHPPTPCDCRVNVHKICWDRWAERSGDACVICRAATWGPPPPAQPEIILLARPAPMIFPNQPPHHFRCMRRIVLIMEITMLGLLIYTLLYMATYQPIPTPQHRFRDAQPMPTWIPPMKYRDEL